MGFIIYLRMFFLRGLVAASVACGAASSACGGGGHLDDARLPRGFCSHLLKDFTSKQPRGIASVGVDVLLVERGNSRVVDGDGAVVATGAAGLNHGLAVHGGFVYASSATTVFRWTFDAASGKAGTTPQVVMAGMNADGQGGAPQGHKTRTVVFDGNGKMYVSIGSVGNVDVDSFRSRIRRFTLDDPSKFPLDFVTDGEVFADGLRNEVGMAFDKHGVLWGVENGADKLFRADLGGDIHNDNPAEELNRFPEADKGKHWGYPYCFTECDLGSKGKGRGTVWAWPSFMDDGTHTDAWCRANTQPPAASMPAHSAPLGITFYEWQEDKAKGCGDGGFPKSMDGYAFMAFHGSWNRDVPTGYKIVSLAMTKEGLPVSGAKPVDLLAHRGDGAKWSSGMRPVDLTFDDCGRLLFTSDGTRSGGGSFTGGMLVRISYDEDVASGTAPSSSSSGACCGEASSDGMKLAGSACTGGLLAVVLLAGLSTTAGQR